jgi:hypothetical protein
MITKGLKNPGWKGLTPGSIIDVPIYKLTYSDEKKACKCNPCWKDLKAAINAWRTIKIELTEELRNAEAWPNGGPVRIHPDTACISPTICKGGKITSKQDPFAAVLWHELIGHAHLGHGHPEVDENYQLTHDGKYVDPTITIENMARECMRKNGYQVEDRAGWYYRGKIGTGFSE